MTTVVPLPTPLGELRGRTISLVDLELSTYPHQVRARCRIWREGGEIPGDFVFTGVLSVRVDELDFSEYHDRASFAEIEGSPWLQSCRARDHSAKVLGDHRHLVLRTYDDVIEVLCRAYSLTLGELITYEQLADDES